MFDQLKRAIVGGSAEQRERELEAELERVAEAIEKRRKMLDERRQSRLQALFPDGPVAGSGDGRFPELDPINFDDQDSESWLVEVATRVIDKFPGAETLLSQLDHTFHAFSDANHYRVQPDGPYSELLTWRDELLAGCDVVGPIPIYVRADAMASEVLGCKDPFVVVDRNMLNNLETDLRRRFHLATLLGHLFFGNLRIFSFHRLMGVLDKLPSMGTMITRGLGMLPVVGNTISRGFELARTVNNQLIRKTNLVVGMRQKLLCDRLAVLLVGSADPAYETFARIVFGHLDDPPSQRDALIAQGREIHERFSAGAIDLHMLSVVGPTASFAAWRAFKLHEWVNSEDYKRIVTGHYVTRTRLRDYQKAHKTLEEEIRTLEQRLVDLADKHEKLATELQALRVAREPEGPDAPR